MKKNFITSRPGIQREKDQTTVPQSFQQTALEALNVTLLEVSM